MSREGTIDNKTCINTNDYSVKTLENPFMIILFYLYHPIDDIDRQLAFQKELCESLELNGRVRVSNEGLNVVLSGLTSRLNEYERRLCVDGLFGEVEVQGLDSKHCPLRSDLPAKDQLFCNLSVKSTPFLVNLEEHSMNITEESCRSKIPASHLSPEEWNKTLITAAEEANAVLIDARNVYESKIGYFSADNIPTILTNTRRYGQLPQILQNAAPQYLAGKNIFMYCTGGVRCERVSKYIQVLAESDSWNGEKPKGIYQLHGGIQRYLEKYGQNVNERNTNEKFDQCMFKGKNFVFDQRRTDPQIGIEQVGSCIICSSPHSDYDNGSSPCMNNEARCCRCRVLLLICNECRQHVISHGEDRKSNEDINTFIKGKRHLYCGAGSLECVNEGNKYMFEVVFK